eukprot:GHVT01074192.1.p3 GENE.GHVT01074192.1~~GHVT01074192.1.p3  ORF type:complete len:183 (+),score=47.35 GHVT01074192.1:4426-4974(+)
MAAAAGAVASSSSSGESEFVSGYPLPPYFYREYAGGSLGGRPPPAAATEGWRCYAGQYASTYSLGELDSEALLLPETDVPTVELRDRVRALHELFAQQLFRLLDGLSFGRGTEASDINRLEKIHLNFLHCLIRLRTHATCEEIVLRLEKQLQKRRLAIDTIKVATSQLLHRFANATPPLDPK